MRILVGWEDPAELDLISLYLNVADNQVELCSDAEEFRSRALSGGPWDAILLSTVFPDPETALALCEQLRVKRPECPLVGACPQQHVFRIARFLTCGMRQYVVRDPARDYLFLLHVTLQGAVHAARAEREERLAERLRDEIESVRRLQQAIVPRDVDCPAGYRIRARYESAQIQVLGGRPVVMAGGDYCDVLGVGEQTYAVLVGDASGHGMPSCLAIMIMQALARMMLDWQTRGASQQMKQTAECDPATFLGEMNRRLCQQDVIGDWGGFITLLFGILHTGRHELHWASAGHAPPLCQDLAAGAIAPIVSADVGGFPLGIVEDADYATYRFAIPPASRLLLYTDGMAEAFPPDEQPHREFGLDGIIETLRGASRAPVDEALQQLFRDSHAFTGGVGRHDDTSAVLIERD